MKISHLFLCLTLLSLSWGNIQGQCDASFTWAQGAPPNCSDDPVTFTSNANPADVATYVWNFGDGNASGQANPVHTYNFVPGGATYNVTLTVTLNDSAGTTCTTNQNVTVPGGPVITVAADSVLKCIQNSPDTLFSPTFTITNAAGIGSFIWDFGDGSAPITSPALTQQHTYDCYGTYQVTITAAGETCPSYRQNVYFYTNPIASNQVVGQPVFCEGDTVTVMNQTNFKCGNIQYYEWDWGALGNSYTVFDTATQKFVYDLGAVINGNPTSNGFTTEVRLTAYNFCFSHYNISQLTILPGPHAGFNGPDTLCMPSAIATFTNTTYPDENYLFDPTQFVWDFGDSSPTSTVPDPTHDYSAAGPGVYTVTLTATNGCGTSVAVGQVVVVEPPVAELVPDTTQGCAPVCIDFGNNSTPDMATVGMTWNWDVISDSAWSFGPNSAAGDFDPTICFNAPDSFLVVLTATNLCGEDRDTVGININISPEISLTNVPDTCGTFTLDTLPYVVSDYGSPITNYTWTTTGAPNTHTGDTLPPITFAAGQVHTITLEVENECGITPGSTSFLVDTVPAVNVGPDFEVCINDSAFQLTADPDSNGFWLGTGVTPGGVFAPPGVGTFELVYTYEGSSCFAYDTLQITVVDTPQVVARADTSFCLDPSVTVTLTATPLGGTWSGPNLINGNQFVGDTAGTFVFWYAYTDTTGCPGQDAVVVTVNPLPEVNIPDSTIFYCLTNTPQPLPTATPPGGDWFGPGVSNASGEFTPSLLGGPDTVTVYYEFTTDSGCYAFDSLIVEVISADSVSAGPGDSLCFNAGADTLSGFFPKGGVWAGNGIIANSAAFNTLNMNVGANEVIYTFAPGTSCEASDTTVVFIRDTLAVDITGTFTLCADDAPITLGVNQPGGTWSGVGITDVLTGAYDPTMVSPGLIDTVTYTLPNANGCVSRDVQPILVDSLPTAQFDSLPNVCIGDPILFANTSVYATAYDWDFGDATGSIFPNPTKTYGVGGNFIISLIATSANGCVDTFTRSIEVTTPPSAVYTQSADSGCAVLSLSFTNQSNAAGGTYLWDFGNGLIDTTANPPVVDYLGGVYDTTYNISLTIANQCATSTQTSTVKVFPLPSIEFGPAVNSGCSPFPVDFSNVSKGGPNSYFWYQDTIIPGTEFSLDSIPPTQFYTHLPDTGFSTYRIFVVAQNACGFDTAEEVITVYPNTVDAVFNTNPTEGCAPLTVQFRDLSGAPFQSWDIDGTQPTSRTPSYTFTQPGTYTIYHYANNGCSYDTNTVQVTVYPAPTAAFVADTNVVCTDGSVSFTDISVGTTGVEWDFGDGNATTLINPTHQYLFPGNFTVTFIVQSDTNGCRDTATLPITVLPPPPISFTLSDTAGCPPLTVQTGGTPPGLSYIWDFGDTSSPVVQQHPSHVYTQTGFFTLSLQVENALGCQNDSSAQIRIFPVPTAGFIASDDTLCGENAVFSFANTSTPPPLQYQWIMGGTNDTINLASHDYAFDSTGVFPTTLTVTNVNGCSDDSVINLVVLPQPVAQIGADSMQGCVPFTVNFSDLSVGGGSRVWQIDGQTFTVANPSYTFLTGDTTYEVILISDTADYCFDADTILIETAEPPVADFSASGYEFCQAQGNSTTVQFQNNSVSALPLSHFWDFGDGNTSPMASPTHIYSQPGHYPVTLTVTNPYGCTDQFIDTIYVYPQPVAQIGADTLQGCVPFTVNFSDLSQNNSSREWQVDGGTLSNASFTYTFNVPDTVYEVILVVDTADFCFAYDTIQIRTSSLPVADFSIDIDEHCDAPAPVQFTDLSSATLPLTYNWAFGDGNSSTQVSPAHTYASVDSFFISLTVTNSYGCTDVHEDTVVVHPQPVAQIGVDTLQGCVPFDVNFSDLSQNNSRRTWYVDEDTLGVPGFSYTFLVPDTIYEVLLEVDTAGLCFAYDTVEIRTASLPQAAFTVDQDEFCDPPATVQFTNGSAATLPLTYVWSFGDGDGSVVTNPNHVYTAVAHHPVQLIATNSYGCRDTAVDTIYVYPQPEAAFFSDTSQGCVPFAVQFTDQSVDAASWRWTIDGQTVYAQHIDYTFVMPDVSYQVWLVVDTADFCYDSTSLTINVASPPLANFGLAWEEFCGTPALNEFTDLSQSTRPLQYNWSLGDGGSSVVPSPNHVYNATGSYVVSQAIVNDYGCRDTLTDTVKVYPQPEASLRAEPDTWCAPMDVAFTNLSTGFSRVRWDFGDDSGISIERDPAHTYFASDTIFTVRLEVDTAGFCFDDTTYQIRVGSFPIANFEASVYENCGPTDVAFTNLSSTQRLPLTYLWDLGNGETSTQINPQGTYTTPGTYEVKLITRNSYGCPDSATQVIEIVPQPMAMFAVDEARGCQAFTPEFINLSTNANRWYWSFGDGGSSQDSVPNYTFGQIGRFDVQLIATWDDRCADTVSFADFIQVDPTPIADFFTQDSMREGIPDGTVKFLNTSTQANDYFWDFDDNGATSSQVNPVYRYLVNRTFEVQLIARLGACADTIVKPINPLEFGDLHVPNAMMPLGGPGEYSLFFPKGIGLEAYHIAVYTGWGELVWESTALEDGVPTEYWDGTINGELASQNVFVWKVHRARFVGGREWSGPREGSLTLIR